MFKVILILSICLAVGHKVNSANTNRAVSPRSDGEISFVEDDNEMDFKQRIQSDKDRFKVLKEMAMKSKKTVLVTAPAATTASFNDCTPETELLILPTSSANVMTSQNDDTDAVKSVPTSTIRQISINLGNDDEEYEDTEQTTIQGMPGTIDNRFILTAPKQCVSGKKVDAEGKCRAVI